MCNVLGKPQGGSKASTREAMRAATTSSVLGAGPLKPFAVHILRPQLAPGAGHGATGFNLSPLGCSLALFPLVSVPRKLPFAMGMLSWAFACQPWLISF